MSESYPNPDEYFHLLQEFVSFYNEHPEILNAPELGFLREWVAKLGGQVSSDTTYNDSKAETGMKMKDEEEPVKVESEVESELELDMTDVIEGDNEPSKSMGDANIEVTDAMLEQADIKRIEAQTKLAEGAFEDAIELFTVAIENNPHSAVLYAKRAQCYIKLQKPNAAIRDCNRALEINENSSQALKWRGKAHRMLGNWEAAYIDFCKAQSFDYDEEVQTWCKEVEINAKKIAEHKRKYERHREEKEAEAKRERIRKAQEEEERSASTPQFPGFPGGASGFGALNSLMSDPEIIEALQDLEVQKAFADISLDPSKIAFHQSNPKVQKIMEKIAKKFGCVGPVGGVIPGFANEVSDTTNPPNVTDLD